MKNFVAINLFIICTLTLSAQQPDQQPSSIGQHIVTSWGKQIEAERAKLGKEELKHYSAIKAYPRPQMRRNSFVSLNGEWQYAITERGAERPAFDDNHTILVPYPIESELSGVGLTVGESNELWYNCALPNSGTIRQSAGQSAKGGDSRILLQFGAVDWQADVWINDRQVGTHNGGYTPFSFDITDLLQGKHNTLTLRVWDPTDQSTQPRGKQTGNPKGIWYTAVTGIWQTVWIEVVPSRYISSIQTVPDLDNKLFTVETKVDNAATGDKVTVVIRERGGTMSVEGSAEAGRKIEVKIDDPKLWTPDTPQLYDLEVTLSNAKGKTVDRIESYTAMRKISAAQDGNGIMRMMLNNKPCFMFGPLDQGWWPDGLYTAPSDQALLFDVVKTKEWGFNMIRKHVKVEPELWYSYCDSIGLLVWQDMPSGDLGGQSWVNREYMNEREKVRTRSSEDQYYAEWREIIDLLRSHPSIAVWVPFNEAWGQFKTTEVTAWTKQYDPTRLVNSASGGNHFVTGDILDLHNYPQPEMYMYDKERVTVLGEYGGIGCAVKGHLWNDSDKNWGYVKYDSPQKATDEYENYAIQLIELIHKGFSAAVYTQTTDVENEVNGIMTYDRAVIKMNEARLRAINRKVIETLAE